MSKKEIVVRCVFSPGEKELSERLEESFRVYLRRILLENAEGAMEPSR